MKRLVLLVGLMAISLGSVSAADSTQFERVRERLRQQLERPNPDGTPRISKQFRRWEWFWQGRLREDGSFPTPDMYMNELNKLRAAKPTDDPQAPKTWRELGPIAPDLPGESASWDGIGRVNVIEFSRQNPAHFWAGSASGGVWRSTNSGGSWQWVNIPIVPVLGVSDIAISPKDDKLIYVATGDVNAAGDGNSLGFPAFTYGLIKSTDGGSTWNTTGLMFDVSQQSLISRLFIDPTNTDIVVAATYSGIRRSTDGGATWRMSVNGQFRDMIAHPTNSNILYASTWAPVGGSTVFRSTDNGVSWENMFSVPTANRIRLSVTKATPNVLALVASNAQTNGLDGVYKSTDAAESFLELPTSLNLLGWSSNGGGTGGQGFYDLAMEISPTNANVMYVGGVNIWRTTNNGQSWLLSAHWTGSGAPWVHADQHFFKFHPTTGVLYATHDGGIARSTDQGISWRDISNGLKIQQQYGLATSNINPSITISGSQDNGTSLTKNNGTTYVRTLGGDGMMAAIDYIDPQIMYASQYNGQFYRTTNQGTNWIFTSNPNQRGESMAAWVSPVAADPKNQNVAYIGYGQIYKTTNGGVNWSRISQIATNTPSRLISISPSDPRHIYVAYNTALWFTTNGGTNWQQQTGLSGLIMGIEVHPTNPKRYYVAIGGFSAGLKVLQVDNGTVTNITGNGLPNVPCNTLAFQAGTPNRIFAGTDLGVFVSDEGSGFWTRYGSGLPPVMVSAMRVVAPTSVLRISTYGRGTWEIDIKQCTATKPTITAQSPTTTCSGDSVVLRAADGFDAYRWNTGDTTQTIVLKTVQNGPVTVSVQDANGCTAVSNPITVTIQQGPTRPLITQRGPDTLRSSAIGGITVFQWFRDGVLIEGATGREHVTQINGKYTVRVENANRCQTMSNEYNFVFTTSVAEDVTAGRGIAVTPNPARDVATVSMPVTAGRVLDVLSLTGETVMSLRVDDGAPEVQLDIQSMARGAYIVRVRSGQSLWMTRLIRD